MQKLTITICSVDIADIILPIKTSTQSLMNLMKLTVSLQNITKLNILTNIKKITVQKAKKTTKIIFLVLLIISILCNILSSVLLWAKKEKNTNESNDSLLSVFENYYNLFSDDGLCLVKAKYDKYGYIDKNGVTIIKPAFDYAESFIDGKAIVEVDGKFGIINTKGEYIIEPQYDYIESYSCGLACVSKNELYGYIDESGELVVPLEYPRASSMYEDGYAIVLTMNKKYALLTKDGVLINLNLGDLQVIGEFNYLEEICEVEGCYNSANGDYCEEHDKTLTDDNCIWPDCEEERKYGEYCFKHYCGMDD